MSSKSKAIVAVDNTARRTWDKDAFRKQADEKKSKDAKKDDIDSANEAKRQRRLERDPLHQGLIVARSDLKARDYQLDLASRLGKTQVVGINTPLSQQAGFYCAVCDCLLRDSQSYLDHINGKYHNRALGMSLRVERSSVDQVRQRLQQHKQQAKSGTGGDVYVPDGMERKALEMAEAEEAEEAERREKKEKKKREREKEAEAAAADADPDMMALMGFGGFGTSSKK